MPAAYVAPASTEVCHLPSGVTSSPLRHKSTLTLAEFSRLSRRSVVALKHASDYAEIRDHLRSPYRSSYSPTSALHDSSSEVTKTDPFTPGYHICLS
jgi:hypothetical protein